MSLFSYLKPDVHKKSKKRTSVKKKTLNPEYNEVSLLFENFTHRIYFSSLLTMSVLLLLSYMKRKKSNTTTNLS